MSDAIILLFLLFPYARRVDDHARTFHVAGVLDAQAGHAYPERRYLYVHLGSEVSGDPSGQVGELDVTDQVTARARLRRVRVPGQHRAEDVAQL